MHSRCTRFCSKAAIQHTPLLFTYPHLPSPPTPPHSHRTGEFANSAGNKVVQWFWELVRSYEHEQKAKLLQFVTGTSGVPIQGFAYLQVCIVV